MINNFEKLTAQLHDARLFGFLLDSNPKTMDLNFILYVQIFSDYNCELYSLEKALIVFEKASITKLRINNDLFGGQFFVTDIVVEQLKEGKLEFNFVFNDTSIELILTSENVRLISSGQVEENNVQFLPTNWEGLLN